MSNVLIEVHETPEELAIIIAGEVLNRIADLQAAGLVPHVGLTGGTIADAVHREIARLADGSGVDWGAVEFWFGDERFVEPDSPERNAGQARAAFLDALEVPEHRIHAMPSTADAHDVDSGAATYAAEVRSQGQGHFDILMLGVGPDGHIASLFPGSPQLDVVSEVAVGVSDSPKPPPQRISLTFEALRRSRTVFFLVSGEAKAGAVASALAGDDVHETPAAGVTGTDETVWFLDRAAASRL
ncbi:6-phosphogluconolactonase [Nocardioides insulae]|uniref:6-phosphogluconolactonase n=1 Tax=Nocardioides insulae TaxID=394734 RepID=UPI00041095FA|nr:6-phosphogluconolactonase [Nocardioides insulae]